MSIKRPRFSWTRIKGESNVQGGGGNGSVEGRGTGRGIGTDGGSPKGDWSPCRRLAGAGYVWRTGQRWSASSRRVLRLLRGESLEALSREAGVEIYRLDAWRERAMAGLELGLKDRHEPVAEMLDRQIGTSCSAAGPGRHRSQVARVRGDGGVTLALGLRTVSPGNRSRADLARSPFHGEGHRKDSLGCASDAAGETPRRPTTGGHPVGLSFHAISRRGTRKGGNQ